MHFALTSPHSVAGRAWDLAEATTQLKLLDVFHRALFPGGRGVRGSLTRVSASTSSWARTIRSTLARVEISPEEDPGTSLFLPFERQSRSVTIVPASSPESVSFQREREIEMSGIPNPVVCSSVFLSHRNSAFSLFHSRTQFLPLEQGSGQPQCLERVLLGTLIPLFRYRSVLVWTSWNRSPTPRIWTLNSVTFVPIFPLFRLKLPTSASPLASPVEGLLQRVEIQSQNSLP